MAEAYLAVMVDEETYERLAALAARKGRDVASIVAEAVHAYLLLSEPVAEPRLVRIHEARDGEDA